MKLNILHTLLTLSLSACLASCSDHELAVNDIPSPDGKSPIVLSVGVRGVETSRTRAITTLPSSTSEYRAFANSTNLYMIYKSEDLSGANRATKYSKTIGLALGGSQTDGTWSNIDFDRNFTYSTNDKGKFPRYWDDAHARESALSVYAICWPNCNAYGNDGVQDTRGIDFGGTSYASLGWKTDPYSTTVSWQLDNQNIDAKGLSKLDICYSNNISKYTPAGGSEVDARLKFGTQVQKKFDEGKMVFYHMTSKLTFIFRKGDGFSDSDFKFNTGTNVQLNEFNYRVNKFDVATGELASDGSYQTGTISKLWEDTGAETTTDKFVIRGLVFPETDITVENTNTASDLVGKDVVFYINNNKYEVSRTKLYEAIAAKAENCVDGAANGTVLEKYLAGGKRLKPGVHYVFTFTVGKTQIKNITATIVDWETVNADNLYPSNARIKLNLEERTGDKTDPLTNGENFSIYRAADNNTGDINDDYAVYNWAKSYSSDGANLGWDNEHSCWSTSWFWDSNKNFYHFRALCKQTSATEKQVVPGNLTNDATYGDYYTLSHCEKTSTTSYEDILWGAPMTDVNGGNETDDRTTLKWNYGPTTYGFDGLDNKAANAHQIYKAIGPTEDAIKLILFHMMSDVTFKVKTTTGVDKVDLGDGSDGNATTIELQKIHTSGKLFLGNGLVLGSTDNVANSNYTFTPSSSAPDTNGLLTWANYGAIPQSLEDVVLVITTPDHNQYKVALKDVLAASTTATNNIANPYKTVTSGTNAGKYIIDRWYPGFKYNYSFTLKKTGITNLQATVVDWETVEADDETVQIK